LPVPVTVKNEIRLDQFLKWAGFSSTGGQSKYFIISGMVMVNEKVETRRGKLLRNGDKVKVMENEYLVSFQNGEC